MIIQEQITGTDLIRTYSNMGMLIRQEPTGILYPEAVDIETTTYTYTETNQPIESEEISDTEILNILLGRDEHE